MDTLMLLIEQDNFNDETLYYLLCVSKFLYNKITNIFTNKLMKLDPIIAIPNIIDCYYDNENFDHKEKELKELPKKYYYLIYKLIIKKQLYYNYTDIKIIFSNCEDCKRYNFLVKFPSCGDYQVIGNMCCIKYCCYDGCSFTCMNCGTNKYSFPDDGWHSNGDDNYTSNPKDKDNFTCNNCNKDIEFKWWGTSVPEMRRRGW